MACYTLKYHILLPHIPNIIIQKIYKQNTSNTCWQTSMRQMGRWVGKQNGKAEAAISGALSKVINTPAGPDGPRWFKMVQGGPQ